MPLCYFYVALGTTQKQMSKVIGQKATSPLHNTYTLRWARTLPLKSASSVEYRAHTSLLLKWRVRWFSRFCAAYVPVCPTHIDHATCDIHRKGPHSTCCIQGMRPNNITKWISHELFAFYVFVTMLSWQIARRHLFVCRTVSASNSRKTTPKLSQNRRARDPQVPARFFLHNHCFSSRSRPCTYVATGKVHAGRK